MPRNLALVVSFACLAFVAAIITSCGSSGNKISTMCTGGPFNVVGNWQGTFSVNGSGTTSAIGVINSQGRAIFFDSATADLGVGSVAALPSITGACSFSGTETVYPTQLIGGGVVTGTLQGSVSSATSISGTQSNGSSSGTFSLSSFSPMSGSVTALSGARTGEIEDQAVILQVTFTPGTGNNMTFASTPQSSCTANGTLTQEGTSNVFDVSITFGSGAGCPSSSTVNGLAFESNTDYFKFNNSMQGTYLYAISSTSALVLEIF
jgi:hypothetical protein